MSEKFVVAYDSKFEDSTAVLFLVDRKKIKTKWGSTVVSDAKIFGSKQLAQRVADGMRFGNPRVWSLEDAAEYDRSREDQLMHALAMEDSEAGWDGHKDSF